MQKCSCGPLESHKENWLEGSRECVSWCVYLLLVSHGALSPHHNLAAGLCLQLFGCQSTWAQDPPYKVELHKRAKQTAKKKTTRLKEDYTHFTSQPQTVFFIMSLFIYMCCEWVCLWGLCIRDVSVLLRGTKIAHYMGAGLCWWHHRTAAVLLTLSVTTTEWLSRQLPLWVCVRLCVCVFVCYYPSITLLLSWHLFSRILPFNSYKV